MVINLAIHFILFVNNILIKLCMIYIFFRLILFLET
jgi:hypothetical protein